MKIIIFSLLITLTFSLNGQVIPVPGSNLIHTQVMFEYPSIKNAFKYKIEISQWDSLNKISVPYIEQYDNTTATLVSNLKFGFEYRWKYHAFDNLQNTIFTSEEFVFYIKNVLQVNPEYQRVRLNKANCKDSLEGLITYDLCRIIADRSGSPVCYIPDIMPYVNQDIFIRDLRISPAGTLTFLTKSEAIEMNIDGEIIWRAPNDGKVSGEDREFYHHAFCRLRNRNYLVLSNKHQNIIVPNDTISVTVEFGTIIEYDSSGNVLWKWDSQDYIKYSDLFSRRKPDNTYNVITHCNALEIDKDGRYIYLGFRDISRIIKIEKKTGEVISSYGNRMPSGDAKNANGFFRFQHSCTLLHDGNIAVFNNDSIDDPNVISSVIIFSQVDNNKISSELLWKFDCNFDTLTNGKSLRTGNVIEIPNHNLLINMGRINRTFEITKAKEIVWDSFTEKWNATEKIWEPAPQNSSSYASSLYPCYFTASVNKSFTKNGKLNNASINIFNEGTNSDAYRVVITKNNDSDEIISQSVSPGQSIKINIPATSLEKVLSIKLNSLTDNNRYRIVNFQDGTQK
jgi:hypothetical protein